MAVIEQPVRIEEHSHRRSFLDLPGERAHRPHRPVAAPAALGNERRRSFAAAEVAYGPELLRDDPKGEPAPDDILLPLELRGCQVDALPRQLGEGRLKSLAPERRLEIGERATGVRQQLRVRASRLSVDPGARKDQETVFAVRELPLEPPARFLQCDAVLEEAPKGCGRVNGRRSIWRTWGSPRLNLRKRAREWNRDIGREIRLVEPLNSNPDSLLQMEDLQLNDHPLKLLDR
ncbi:MAG: hypothetical protein H0U86_12965 [Chloroflexi bacterium]|nr:hypothetical protein [Chloroflexota bacterium]